MRLTGATQPGIKPPHLGMAGGTGAGWGDCKGRGWSYRIPEQYLPCALEVFVDVSGHLARAWALGGDHLLWAPKVSLAFHVGFG